MATKTEQEYSSHELTDVDPLADPEERRVIFAALDSFRQYRKMTHYNTTHRRRQNLYALPISQWQMLANPPFSLLDNLNAVDDAIDANADVAEEILAVGLRSFCLPTEPGKDTPLYWHDTATANDLAKAHSTIRQFYRDWSIKGSAERDLLTLTICTDLAAFLKPSSDKECANQTPKVLLPGAGLGRLMFDLCLDGWNVEGNEISYHQLLASNWILNNTMDAQKLKIFPFVTTFTNLQNRTQQLREVAIPDVHPGTAVSETLAAGKAVGEMSMSAGDFCVLYSSPRYAGRFDAVVTVFFIDTAPNAIQYIETMKSCLKQDGVWINLGPLLWHFDDRLSGHQKRVHHKITDNNETTSHARPNSRPMEVVDSPGIAASGSFELSNDELLQLIEKMGFHIEKHELLKEGVGYIQDPDSLLQNLYRCSHWIARKLE